jgi:hypothetical protein
LLQIPALNIEEVLVEVSMLSFLRKQESRVSREGGNPVTFCSFLFSQGQVWIPTFVGMTDEVNL